MELITEASGTVQQREGDHQGLSTGLGKRGKRSTNLTQNLKEDRKAIRDEQDCCDNFRSRSCAISPIECARRTTIGNALREPARLGGGTRWEGVRADALRNILHDRTDDDADQNF